MLYAAAREQSPTTNFGNGSKMEYLNGNTSSKNDGKGAAEIVAEEICEKDIDRNIGTDPNFKRQIVWSNCFGFLLLHAGALYGAYLGVVETKIVTLPYAIFIAWLSGEGITIGAHRLWTHRSFKSTPLLSTVLMIMQTMAGQNCIWVWSRDHRQHHRYADTDADPHNARRGFFFSHMGWLMSRKHPLVIKMGKNINMEDLNVDPTVMLQKKYYYLLYFIFAVYIPVAIPVYCWNESWKVSLFLNYFWRYVVILHITWCVNSVAHIFGNKPFDKNILAVESRFTSFISLGEGWHNYHHVFPWDYRTAEFGTPLQLTSQIIEGLARIGMASNLKHVSADMIKARAKRTGDDTYETQISSLGSEWIYVHIHM
ncbi:acyl-CoA Delta-9 desaturase-like [Arctopsyche grandis]|uniref:acyl-CoA Delta-9 desaturase-like n=1 Tax=Arctopsyche grandis TaxID=121162 RepID=UPI00406D9A1C